MSSGPGWAPRPGESHRGYLDRLYEELQARRRAEAGDVAAELAPAGATPPAPSFSPSSPAPLAQAAAAWPPVEPVAGWFQSSASRSITETIASIVTKATWRGGRVFNPRIQKADVRTPHDRMIRAPSRWADDVVADYRRRRVKGDVSVQYCDSVIRRAFEKIASDGRGFVQRSYVALARHAGCSHETVRKVVRWAERHGWLGTLNCLVRDEQGELKRTDNVYLLFGARDKAPVVADVPSDDAGAAPAEKARFDFTVARAARVFHAVATAWGVNAARRSPATT